MDHTECTVLCLTSFSQQYGYEIHPGAFLLLHILINI